MTTVYLGIGSNLGNRQDNCERAIRLLAERKVKIMKRSMMLETEPWGVREQPKFINMAVEAETSLEPEELLRVLKKIEKDIGRLPTSRWGPRVIDLDILFYGDLVISTPDLQIPHPNIADRVFVLQPLAEIAPDKVHPVLGSTIRDLFSRSRQSS